MTAENKDFFEALSMLEHERGITAEYLIEKIKAAIIIAVKKNYEVEEDHIRVDIDPDTGRFDVALIQDIVADEDWYDEHAEIGVTEARKIRSSYEVGDRIITPLKTRDFGRIAAQTAKHVIRQGIREAERNQQLSEIQSRAHDIVQATVTRVDTEKGIVALDLGKGGEAVLPRNEQVPGEVYTEGETLQVYIVDVVSTERGPRVMISRTHPGLVKRLFELEVPEIHDGLISIRAVARIPGERAKIAVESYDDRIDPVGACVGVKGSRIHGIVRELRNENIDVINYTANPSLFIQRALSPAKISSIRLDEEEKKAEVFLRPEEVSLAIGKGGLNIKLASMLTGYVIDVYRDTEEAYEEDIYLDEFKDEIEPWIIDAVKNIGCVTAKSVLNTPRQTLVDKADLEEETVDALLEVLRAEFDDNAESSETSETTETPDNTSDNTETPA